MSETIDIEEFKKEQKKRKIKEAVKNKFNDAVCFYKNNKELCMVAVPLIIGGTRKVWNFSTKQINLRAEKDHRDLDIYDRRADHWWRMKRKPNSNEWKRIAERRENGESYYNILSSMNLLK